MGTGQAGLIASSSVARACLAGGRLADFHDPGLGVGRARPAGVRGWGRLRGDRAAGVPGWVVQGAMVMLPGSVAWSPVLSETLTVKVNVPALVGVPLKLFPVTCGAFGEVCFTPGGRSPAV